MCFSDSKWKSEAPFYCPVGKSQMGCSQSYFPVFANILLPARSLASSKLLQDVATIMERESRRFFMTWAQNLCKLFCSVDYLSYTPLHLSAKWALNQALNGLKIPGFLVSNEFSSMYHLLSVLLICTVFLLSLRLLRPSKPFCFWCTMYFLISLFVQSIAFYQLNALISCFWALSLIFTFCGLLYGRAFR